MQCVKKLSEKDDTLLFKISAFDCTKVFAFEQMDKFKTLFSVADSGVLIVSMGSGKKSRISDSGQSISVFGQKQLFLLVFLRPWIKRVYPGIIIRCDLAFFLFTFCV